MNVDEFGRFSRAVQLHEGKNYTICDMLHLIKCVVNDLRSCCGDINTLSIGDDEQFGNLMSNQCYILGELMDNFKAHSKCKDDAVEDLEQELAALTSDAKRYDSIFKDIRTMTEKKSDMENKLTELKAKKEEYDKLNEEIKTLEQSISEADDFDLDASREKKKTLKDELDKKTQNNAVLLKSIEDYKTKIKDAEKTEKEKKNDLEKLKNDASSLQQRINSLNDEFNTKKTEKEALIRSVESLDSTIGSLNGDIDACKIRIQECEVILKAEEENLSEENKTIASELRNLTDDLLILKTDRQKAEDQKIKLTDQVSALKADTEAISEAVSALNNTSDSYNEKIMDFSMIMNSTKELLDGEYKVLLSGIDGTGKEISKLQDDISRKTELKKSIDARMSALNTKSASLQEMINAMSLSEKELENSIIAQSKTIRDTNNELSDNLSQLLGETEEAAKKILNMRRQFHELNGKKNKQKSDAERLSEFISAANKLIAAIDGDINEYDAILKEMSDTLADRSDKLNKEYLSKMSEAKSLAEKVVGLRTSIKQLNKQIACDQASSEKLKAEKDDLTLKSDHIKQVIEELNGDMTGLAKLFNEQNASKSAVSQKAMSKLESDYDRLNSEYNQFYYNILKPKLEDNIRLQEKIKNKDYEYKSAEDINNQLKSDLSKIESNLNNLKNNNTSLTKKIAGKKEQARIQEQKYHELNDEAQSLDESIDRFKLLNAELNDIIIPNATRLQNKMKSINESANNTANEKTADICSLIERQYSELMSYMTEIDGKVKTAFDSLTALRQQYEAKTIQISGYNKEIESLQQKIRELEAKNEKEQISGAKQQLLNRIQELNQEGESYQTAISKYKEEINVLSQSTDALQKDKTELLKQKESLEKKKALLVRCNANIQAILGDDYQKRLRTIEDDIGKLSPLNENLRKMMKFIISITGNDYIINDDLKEQIDKYNIALNELKYILPEIQKQLTDSASKLSLKIKMEEI